VEKFYMFFNPQISLVRVKKFNGKLHWKFFAKNDDSLDPNADISKLDDNDWRKYPDNTEYGIGWLPLGGYCAIGGMVDETKSVNDLPSEPQPWELRTKPAWQRFLVMFGGVFFNFLLAILLYAAILNHWGEEYLRNDDAIYGIATNELSYEIGFRDGDRVLAFDGEPIDDFSQLQISLIRSQATKATVLRGGDTITINIDPVYISAMLNTPGMFSLSYPFEVKELQKGSINYNSGLKAGDRITAINGKPMSLVKEIQSELKEHKGDSITATVIRDAVATNIPLAVDTAGLVQVMLNGDLRDFFEITEYKYSFFAAIPAGATKAWNYIKGYVQELKLIFSPETKAYKSVGSFITIGRIFPGSWDWLRVWSLTAMLSIMLAVMNLLPIPALDGGHILFILIEIITGRKPGEKFLEVAQTVGMIILLAIMVLALGNDILSLFK